MHEDGERNAIEFRVQTRPEICRVRFGRPARRRGYLGGIGEGRRSLLIGVIRGFGREGPSFCPVEILATTRLGPPQKGTDQAGMQLDDGVLTVIRVGRHGPSDRDIDRRRQTRSKKGRPRPRPPADPIENGAGAVVGVGARRFRKRAHRAPLRVPHPRAPQGEHLKKQDAQRKYVRANIDLPPGRLLGSHIETRTQDATPGGDGGRLRRIFEDLGEAKIQNPDLIAEEHHVGRLEVPVDDAAGVGIRNPGDELPRQLQDLIRREMPVVFRSVRDLGFKRLPVDQLENEIRFLVIEANAIRARQIRVIELQQDPSFASKTFSRLVIDPKARMKKFERDGALLVEVLSTPYRGSSPTAETVHKAITLIKNHPGPRRARRHASLLESYDLHAIGAKPTLAPSGLDNTRGAVQSGAR